MEEFIKKFMCCPILQYNHFKIEPDENMGYCTSIEKFEKDITSLLKFGYSSISLYQLYLYKINNIDLPNNTFCIIMEGGYESNYVLAFDILKKHNIHADIFISTDLVGLKCHPKYPNFIPHFSWDQATEMINSGLVNIYAKWHPLDENKGEFKKVILDKKEELMSHLDQKQYIGNFFAFLYPYYDEKKIDDIFSIGINTQIIDYLKLTKENISKGCVGSIPVNFYTDVLDVIDEYKDILMFNTGKRESIKQDIDVDIQYNNFMSLNLESIKLPIFEKPMIKNYLRHAFPLSILFVDREEKYNKFILSNNIQLIANPLFLEFDYHNHYYSYWPCITCNRVTSDILRINNIDILSYIYKGLQNGYYSDIWLDSYYIPGKPAYKYYHLTHGLLIFGYDHEKKVFQTMTYTNKDLYEELDVNIENMIKACSNNYFEYINLIKRNVAAKIDYNLEDIKRKLRNYIDSTNYDSDNTKWIKESYNSIFGVNACKWFREYVNNINGNQIHPTISYTFVEHKKCMAWRIKTISEIEKINIPNLDNSVNDMYKYSNLILNFIIKYNMTKSISLINKITNYIDKLICLEVSTLESLLSKI